MLVSREQEPITPFISKVRALYTQLHVSTIMVIGTWAQEERQAHILKDTSPYVGR